MARYLSQKEADEFSKDAREYTKKVTASKEAAREALVKLGTHTPKGKLTKNYK